ncbi:MAG: 1-(5-phosphoribosyl)-5-[(5-phosphoribosylamino)methylideneamino]imidazole-4-carboxamide isomerase [Clostridiales bacterium]|nr:1-(5-phosphoribosyl)-5-[(5-phosphoribosylamino)methylideneamino]imidazole-4-carboxamide isomerase [Clostridiales bacterium]
MLIFPAIDIIDGKVVRLLKGDYNEVKRYSITPKEAAQSFINAGATCLHAVDLDGAKSGKAENAETVKKLIDSGLFVEIGGGIRSEEQIEKYLSYGTKRVILGTVAVKNPSFVKEMAQKFPNKIAVGVDASNERVAISGWREITDINSYDFCKKMRDIGVENIIYTDISKDGALSGTNLFAYEKLVKIEGLKITASGGITYLNEIKTLKEMGVYGAILGKALYENKINLAEAVKLAQGD